VAGRRYDLIDVGIAVGILGLSLPWFIRTISEHTDMLTSVRITEVYLAATILLVAAATVSLLTGRTPVRLLTTGAQIWVAYLFVACAGMFFVGVMRGNPFPLFLQEAIVVGLFLSGIVLGASFQNWPRIDGVMLPTVGVLGIATTVFGLIEVGNIDAMMLRRSTVYSASTVLLPATFYAICLARLRSRKMVVLAVMTFLAWVILQVLFLKRAPLLRAGATVILGLLFLPPAMKKQRFGLFLGTCIIVLFAGSTLFVTERGRDVRKSISQRFQVFDVIGSYVGGVRFLEEENRYNTETFRFRETSILLDNMDWGERLYGIGTGGYITDMRLSHWDLPVGDKVIPASKNSVHVGVFWSFMKGGLLFFVVFNAGLLALLFNWRRLRSDPLGMNCFLFVGLNVAFSLLEGFWMQPGAESLTFMMGAAVGYCLLRSSIAPAELAP
jgi:hypothetical protein